MQQSFNKFICILIVVLVIPLGTYAQSKYLERDRAITLAGYGNVPIDKMIKEEYGVSLGLGSFFEAGFARGRMTASIGHTHESNAEFIAPSASVFFRRTTHGLFSASFKLSYIMIDNIEEELMPLEFSLYRDFTIFKVVTLNPEFTFTKTMVYHNEMETSLEHVYSVSMPVFINFTKRLALFAGPKYNITATENSMQLYFGMLFRLS